MSNKRVSYIDIARCIGICSIVLAHSCRGEYISVFLYSYQVPLFFFLAGLTFKTYGSFKEFIEKKIKTILIPFWVVGLLYIFIYYLFGQVVKDSLDVSTDNVGFLETTFYSLIYGTSKNGYMKWNTPMWFLPCLFALETLAYGIEKLNLNNKKILVCVVISILGYIFNIYCEDVYLPYQLETACQMLVFFQLGQLFKQVYSIDSKYWWLSFVMCIGINIWLCRYNGIISVRLGNYHNHLLFFINAISGIGWVVAMSHLINKNNILEHVGCSSLNILLWHKPILLALQMAINRLIRIDITNTVYGYIYVICASIIAILGSLIIEKYSKKILHGR